MEELAGTDTSSEDMLQYLLDRVNDIFLIVKDDEIMFSTNNIVKYLDKKENITLEDIGRIIHPNDRNFSMVNYNNRKEGKNTLDDYFIRLLRPDGGYDFVNINVQNYIMNREERYLVRIRDVTDLISMKSVIFDEKLKGDFYLDVIIHDISNLMQGALGWLDYYYQDAVSNDERKRNENIENISSECQYLLHNFKILSRRDIHSKLHPIDLADCIDRSMVRIRKEHDVRFETRYHTSSFFIIADQDAEEIFYQLFKTSLEMGDGQDFEIETSATNDGIIIRIKCGMGKECENMKRILEREIHSLTFERRKYIGLFIAKLLVERYRGNMDIKKEIGKTKETAVCEISFDRFRI